MKSPLPMFTLLLLLISAGFAAADYGRYQVILDRQLLGRPPEPEPRATPTPAPPPQAPSWANEYTMTMLIFDENRNQVRVGLQHIRDGHGYLLTAGETYDHHNFTLESADPDRGRAVIQRGRERHEFSLQAGAAIAQQEDEDRGGRNVRRPPAVQPRRQPPARPQRPQPTPEPQQSRFESPEELEAHLQNVQMDAIRTGAPPLPIPLTPEMDAQLVSEGVLPPLENQ